MSHNKKVLSALEQRLLEGRPGVEATLMGLASIRREKMPEPEENDFDISEGGRMKTPVRYD